LPPGRKGHISMDGSVLDPEGARERLAAWKGRIDQLAANTKAMSDRLQQLQETVADPRGLAKVTVDSTGSLIGLQLTSRIQGLPPDVIAQAIMDTVRRAKARLAERSREIVEETIGTESAAGRAIAASVGKHLLADDVSETVTKTTPAAPPPPTPSPGVSMSSGLPGSAGPAGASPPSAPASTVKPSSAPRRPNRVDEDDDEEPFEFKFE